MATPKKNDFFVRQLQKLNPAQRQAVEQIEGPVMVVAGPGSGKTQVVALRVAQILQTTQLNARNILALTFTEAGGTALRRRVETIIGSDAYQVTIATFHSFANDIIATFPYIFGFAVEATQVTDLDRLQIIHHIVDRATDLTALRPVRSPTFHVPTIASAIRRCKQENVSPDQLEKLAREEAKSALKKPKLTKLQQQSITRQLELNSELAVVYQQYQEQLKKRGLYDYEDMILFALEGLRENADVRAYYQERYQYFLVDEFQDTNNAQNALVEALADFFPNPNLCVVGDDKQAIYRFQGASVANMLNFVQKYPQAKIISLTTNYRSGAPILTAATEAISHNQHQLVSYLPQLEANLTAAREKTTSDLKLLTAVSVEAEYAWIVTQLKERASQGIGYTDMAVLFRRNADAAAFRDFAAKSGLPLAGVITTNLFEQPEVQQIISLLQACHHPADPMMLVPALRLIEPISPITLARLARALIHESDLKKTLQSLKLSAKEKVTIEKAVATLTKWVERLPQLSLAEFVEEIVSQSRLLSLIKQQANALERLELVKAFLNEVRRYNLQNPSAKLVYFLEYLELLRQYRLNLPVHRLAPQIDGVFVQTVHGAKGLEFDTVILADVSNKIWNDRAVRQLIKLPPAIAGLSAWDEAPVEDERRLFYVGLTRAKNQLYLTYAQFDADGREVLPSQFVAEIASHFNPVNYEPTADEAEKFITTAISPIPGLYLQSQERQVVRELITTNPFSYTDYRTYQLCPKQYLLNSVLHFPTRLDPRLTYGTIIHRALELFYKQFRTTEHWPTRTALQKYFQQASHQTENFQGKSAIVAQAGKLLEAYYDHAEVEATVPVGVEYNFRAHHVLLDSIWLTGKFDRIDLIDPVARTVRVIDYKTGAQAHSRNQIEGQTKTSDGALKQQLIFYALLTSLDRHFPYVATEFALKFLDDKHTFRQETYQITTQEKDDLAASIKKTYEEILSLEVFEHRRDSFDQGCEICQIFAELT